MELVNMNLWNVRELPLPPISTYKTKNRDIDIKYLHQICQEIKDFFDDNKYLHTEHFLLSRIIYRMKTKFRSAKDLKAVQKVNRALNIFLNVNVSSSLNIFLSLIPLKYKIDTYLPSKNLLDYILVRLQGISKLLERIIESCKISAHLLNERMYIGHFWKIAFMLFSIVSRIYVIAVFTTNRICEFYGKLLPFSCKLLNVGKEFLPASYELPMDLKEWINVDFTECKQMQHLEEPSNIPDIIDFFDLIHDDSDVEFCEEYVLLEDTDCDKVELVDVHRERNISNQKSIQCNEVVKQKDKISEHKSDKGSSLKGFRGFEKIEDVGEVIDNSKKLVCAAESSSLSDSIIEQTFEVGKKSIDDSILLDSNEPVIELKPLYSKKCRMSKKKGNLHKNKAFNSRLDNKSDSATEEPVQVGKKNIDCISLLSDESIIEELNSKKGRKSKKIRNLNINIDNIVGKSYSMGDSWKNKSVCNQNKLVFKRKVESDSGRKIKKRKLSNSQEFSKPSTKIIENCKLPLNKSQLMKRKLSKNKPPHQQ